MEKKYVKDYLELLLDGDILYTQERLSKIINSFEKVNYFAELKRNLNMFVSSSKLENISITYRNKIIELYHLYESKHLDFVDSDIIPIVLNHFNSVIDEYLHCIYILENILTNMLAIAKKKFFTKKVKNALCEQIMLFDATLESCENFDKEIFNFSIAKDFKKLCLDEKIFILEREESFNPNHNYKNAILHNCEVELGQLGYIENHETKYPLFTTEKEFVINTKILDLIDLKKEEVKASYGNLPYTEMAMIEQLNSYDSCFADLFEKSDIVNVEKLAFKLQNFNVEQEIVDAFGKIITYYQLNWDLETIKQEFVTLNLESKFNELLEKINLGSYDYYPEYCNDRNLENTEKLIKQMLGSKEMKINKKTL